MIRVNIVPPMSICFYNFFVHVLRKNQERMSSSIINESLKEYRATYHCHDEGDAFSYEEWIDFENEKDYAWFILRWS